MAVRSALRWFSGCIRRRSLNSCGVLSRAAVEGRPYVKFAIFWGRWKEIPTKPEAACQHGRLYPPTASDPGVVVLTDAIMDQSGADHPDARPIPDNLTGFTHVWKMGPQELATARRLSVPGL
jgi:hypothetical protein